MKKKNIILLALSCILLTGCTVNYNLEIDMEDNTFKEKISGTVLNEEIEEDENATDTNIYNYLLNDNQNAFYKNETDYYEKEIKENINDVEYTYTYTYNRENFKNSNILNSCFTKTTIEEKDDNYYIILSGDFNCNYAKTTNISIKTKNKVLANNANKIKNKTYTWTIDKDNNKDLSLYITISKNQLEKTNILNWNTLKTVALIIIVSLSLICLFVIKKKNNE